MAYTIINDKPYFYSGKGIYPCLIEANRIEVDFEKPVKKVKVDKIYTESEVKHALGVFMIDTWDSKLNKVVKKTNKTVSSIEAKTKTESKKE